MLIEIINSGYLNVDHLKLIIVKLHYAYIRRVHMYTCLQTAC